MRKGKKLWTGYGLLVLCLFIAAFFFPSGRPLSRHRVQEGPAFAGYEVPEVTTRDAALAPRGSRAAGTETTVKTKVFAAASKEPVGENRDNALLMFNKTVGVVVAVALVIAVVCSLRRKR